MNNKTKQEQIREEILHVLCPNDLCKHEEEVDKIMAIFAREQGELLKEIIAFRSPYVYDDYSSLYQRSGEIWTEYAEKEGKFLKEKLEGKTKKERPDVRERVKKDWQDAKKAGYKNLAPYKMSKQIKEEK